VAAFWTNVHSKHPCFSRQPLSVMAPIAAVPELTLPSLGGCRQASLVLFQKTPGRVWKFISRGRDP